MTGMSTESRSLVVGVRLLLALVLLGAGSSVLVAQEVGVVTNYAANSFTVFDRATGATLAVVPTGAGSSPLGLAITPDGRTLLVANVGTNEVAFYDLRTMPPALLGSVPTGSPCPVGGVTISSDGRFAITSHIWCVRPLTLTSIDVASRSILNQFGGLWGSDVFDLVLTRDNRVALLMGYDYTSTIPVSPDGLLIGPFRYGDSGPGTTMTTMAIAPNGRLALATAWSAQSAAVFAIDENDAVRYTGLIPTGNQPSGVAFAPNGSKVYVVNRGDSNIAVLSIDSNNVVSDTGTRIAIPGPPSSQFGVQGMAITPDSRLAYVPNWANGTVTVVL
jgi:DNA-binding beta-propeller fold protein YncE